MGVSLCYLRGRSIGAFGWGLLRLLDSDFRTSSADSLHYVDELGLRRHHPINDSVDGLLQCLILQHGFSDFF
ncbi:hypothetical protein SAMN03159382_01440 [Pseudomonas sp. NFACC23-1]|nr:hypothetical protein SAMN03159386_01100 [Pseudomonas sp. NFACC17-2]SEJ18006.1 hypothetical protein SAMN03159382_01440 [Pseudomonas sp. NFACC23-1]SFW14261.1 hypothetical protein SAMN05660640_00060 [Pseudomonas sp. NFACC16-2]